MPSVNRQEMSNRIADRTEPWDMLVIGSGAIGVGIARIPCCNSGKDSRVRSAIPYLGLALVARADTPITE